MQHMDAGVQVPTYTCVQLPPILATLATRPVMGPESATPQLQNSRSLSAKDAPKNAWLDAWADPVAGLKAFSNCIHTCNLYGDGDWRLIVADADRKIKVWKGTVKASEHTLLDDPVAITSFMADRSQPRVPTLAVAAGPNIYMFKNLRPYYKFTLPDSNANAEEDVVWKQADAGKLGASDALQQLQQLQQQKGMQLANRSLQLLKLAHDLDAAQQFVQQSQGQAVSSTSSITCMDVIKQATDGLDETGQLIVGTEDCRILVLDPSGTAVDRAIVLPAVPALLATTGEADVGYRVTVAARDGRLYSIKTGTLSRTVIQLDSQPVGIVRFSKQVIVATMADVLHSYTGKGAKQYSVYMPASITALQTLTTSTSRVSKCVVVALSNGEVRLYNDKALVSVHSSPSPVRGLCAGRYAREDNSLITITAAGGLDIKIMPRHVNLQAAAAAGSSGPPAEQELPLDVPKKTRLYVEQTQREREQAVDMHRVFQRDLVKMRLATARAYVKVLTDGQGPVSHAVASQLSMNVQVQGLGPRFQLLINLSNQGQTLATDLQMLAQADDSVYQVHTPHVVVPCLVPMLQYSFKVDITSLQPDLADTIRVVVVGAKQQQPLMTALVKMPLSEPEDA